MGWVHFGTQFLTDILIGIALTSQAFSILSAQCCLSSAGQPDFSILCFLLHFLFYLTVSLCSLSVCGLKLIRPLIVRFLFHLFGSPTSIRWNSLLLCHHHYVTFHIEVATCLPTNWAPALPRMVVISIILWNDSSANSVAMSNPKFHMPQRILPSNLVSHWVQYPSFDLEPPNPMVITFITWVTFSTISPRWEWFSLSSTKHASFSVWHRLVLCQTFLPPKCLRYSTGFGAQDLPVDFSTFPTILPVFHMIGCQGFSFSEVFILRYAR